MKPKCKIRVCDCYHESKSQCWSCTRNENHEKGKLEDNYISICDKVSQLYKYLTGEFRPKLSQNKAFGLIYYLQETIHCLPDHIERCDVCGELYDSWAEGYYLDEQYELNGKTLPKKYWGSYCSDECAPIVDFKVS